jgi:hypothetical protein
MRMDLVDLSSTPVARDRASTVYAGAHRDEWTKRERRD